MTNRAFRKSEGKQQLVLRTKSRRLGRKKTLKRGLRKRRRGAESVTIRGFPGFGRREGCSVALMVIERAGSRVDRVTSSMVLSAMGTVGSAKLLSGRKGGRRAYKHGVEVPARVCQVMFALGHVQRMKIIRKLLDGPTTYQAVRRLTKLKPGPLYHHVNQLRLAGLILPRQRDLYELTRAGRNMMLGMMALAPLTHDSRRRPTP